jgi:hypothetical protein
MIHSNVSTAGFLNIFRQTRLRRLWITINSWQLKIFVPRGRISTSLGHGNLSPLEVSKELKRQNDTFSLKNLDKVIKKIIVHYTFNNLGVLRGINLNFAIGQNSIWSIRDVSQHFKVHPKLCLERSTLKSFNLNLASPPS